MSAPDLVQQPPQCFGAHQWEQFPVFPRNHVCPVFTSLFSLKSNENKSWVEKRPPRSGLRHPLYIATYFTQAWPSQVLFPGLQEAALFTSHNFNGETRYETQKQPITDLAIPLLQGRAVKPTPWLANAKCLQPLIHTKMSEVYLVWTSPFPPQYLSPFWISTLFINNE